MPGAVYAELVFNMDQAGITKDNMGLHALRATAVTSPFEQNADIAKRQENKEGCGHDLEQYRLTVALPMFRSNRCHAQTECI